MKSRLFPAMIIVAVLFLLNGCSGEDDTGSDIPDGDAEISELSESAETESDGDTDSTEDEFEDDAVQESDSDPESEAESAEFQEWSESMIGIDPSLCAPETPLDMQPFDPDYSSAESGNFVQDKNFYLLTLFDEVAELRQALASDSTLSAVSEARSEAFTQADCGEDIDCWAAALKWTDEDSETVAAALAVLPQALGAVPEHLEPSGYFHRYSSLSDAELIAEAWQVSAEGLNIIWDDFGNAMQTADLLNIINGVRQAGNADFLFYEPLLRVDMALMEALLRDEAGRYEPLADGENKAALERMAQIDWDAYPFSVMLIPGQGPDTLDVELDPNGALRCDMAAERYLGGVAPFILTSGGHVHPDQTPYCEALEMKKYLMETHGIPENAILIDPHARHTTTNVRNAARMILRYGIPADKPAMTTTDIFQSIGILTMKSRLLEELGYLPYRTVQKMTGVDNCFLASPDALTADPRDPLDP